MTDNQPQAQDEARRKLQDKIECVLEQCRQIDLAGPGCRVNLGLETSDWLLIAAALRADPARGAEEMSTEQIARIMCRHQIHSNEITYPPHKRLSDEARQRAEDAGWKQWTGFAGAIAAAIRALPTAQGGGE